MGRRWQLSSSSEESSSGRVCGLVAYDGTPFHGWARQAGVPTVQGALEACLARVCGSHVPLTVAGRTDAGVHAWGQVVSFDVARPCDLARLRRSLDRMSGPDIAVRSLRWVPSGFSARHSAVSRRYLYRYLTEEACDPFRRRYAWHVGTPLDTEAMGVAAQALVGEHDFSAYCKVGAHGGPMRRVVEVTVAPDAAGGVDLWVEAANFCHQMVRSFAGVLVDVGLGRRPVAHPQQVLESRDRRRIGRVAPPHGLTLWSVRYPPSV